MHAENTVTKVAVDKYQNMAHVLQHVVSRMSYYLLSTMQSEHTFLYTVDSPAAFVRTIPGNIVWTGDAASVTPLKCSGIEMNLGEGGRGGEIEGQGDVVNVLHSENCEGSPHFRSSL